MLETTEALGFIHRPDLTSRKAAELWAENFWPNRWEDGRARFDEWTPGGALDAEFIVQDGRRVYRIAFNDDRNGYEITSTARATGGGVA